MASNPARVLWKRLPTFFPNIKLQLQPLSEEQLSTLMKTGHLDQAVFRTTPNVTKQEIREVLQKVYQIPVTSIHTAIYQGKKVRRGRKGQQIAKKPDYKKVWVNMMDGQLAQNACPTEEYRKEDLNARASSRM